MRRFSLAAVAGLALCVPAVGGGKPDAKPAEGATCGSYGTTIEFLETPREAAAQAKKEGKLVFVLHVSGHLEDPRFL